MTNLNDTLDSIRPDDGTVGDDMPSGDVEVKQFQEEIIGSEGTEDADLGAEAPRRGQRCTSMKLPTYRTEVGANIVSMGVE